MVVNTIPLSKIEFKRIEAEFYQPKFIQAKKIIGEKPLTLFGVKVIHPAEVKRTYTEKGSLKIVLAQNIRDNVMDWSTEKYMDDSVLEYISRNELLSGDVVVTRSGANYGQTSVITNEVESENLYASADVLMLKPGVIGGPLLSTFLNTRIGKLLMIRGVYGAAQPHIAPNYVSHIPFPEFLLEIRDEIADLIHSSRKLLSDSQQLYTQATELLEQELGLDKFNLDESINYKSTFFDIINSHRIDAQHYKPKFAQLINHLKDHFECVRIGTIAFYNQRGVQPVYVEDGEIDVITSQHITSTHLKYDELEKTTKAEFNNHPEAHVSFSDILIYTTGAYIGMTNPYLSNEKALASNHVNILKIKENIDTTYLALVLNTKVGKLQTDKYQRGSAQAELYPNDIAKFIVPIIDETKMKKIGDLIKESLTKLNESKQLLQQAKSKVEERIEQMGNKYEKHPGTY